MKIKKLTYLLTALSLLCSVAYSQQFPDLPEAEYSSKTVFSAEDSLKSLDVLKEDIKNILKNENLKRTKYSLAVFSLNQNKYLFQDNINKALTPASNTKLFTTYSALCLLGKDYYIPTVVYSDSNPGQDSILNGNLYIVGHGDALLSITDIEYLADEIKQLGIKQVNGNIYADGSYFDDITDRMIYAGDKDHVEGLPPITALSIEKNIVQILVRAGSYSGENVSVQTIPASDGFKITITAKVVGGKKRKKSNKSQLYKIPKKDIETIETDYTLSLEEAPHYYGGGSPINLALSKTGKIYISSKLSSNGYQKLKITGSLKSGRTYYYSYHILNPALVIAGALKDRLIYGGVPVMGDIGVKSIKELDSTKKPIFFTIFQSPITDLLYLTNKNSDNYIAETVFKMIGGYQSLDEHTGKSAQTAMKLLFTSTGIDCEKCRLNDGSGLSRRNLCTTEAIIQLLRNASNSGFAEAFDSTLSIAGIDGTLEKRMTIGLAENNLRGKTGTLRNVSALSGYVNTLDGERLAFSFIFNGPNIGIYKSIEDEIGELLAQFFYYNAKN